MTQITTYALLFAIMSCLLDVVIIALLLGFMKSRSDDTIKMALKMMAVLFVAIVVVSVNQSVGQEELPPPDMGILGDDEQPIIFRPDLMQQAASTIARDIFGEEAAVQASHMLFLEGLEGNYSMGNWSLNNSSVIA